MMTTLSRLSFAQSKSRKPNVILIMTDDQGYGDLACHGHPFIKTPRWIPENRSSSSSKNKKRKKVSVGGTIRDIIKKKI